ncbi:hypothetical protein DPMN_143401 [Dreissena polymorpha]|uniref:C1q domain-containing protein n=1 Tax=Dreissena polymorpha TaxID=45954 RepID=A0A9D4GD03_DREPO|nr:hypothetical protein DPMN_143401 [Dreissena polymorpha]
MIQEPMVILLRFHFTLRFVKINMMLHRKFIIVFMSIIHATFAVEPLCRSCPACSPYDFNERLLERVVRYELAFDTILKEVRETIVKVDSALKVMQEDRTKMDATLDDMESKLDNAINIGMTNISEAVSDLTHNSSMAILQIHKENAVLKDQLSIPTIYFHAYGLTTDVPASGQVIVYQSVRVNEGQGYNPTIGKFKVSVPGLYVFVVHYCVNPSKDCLLAIVHQGTAIQSAESKSDGSNFCVAMQVVVRAAIADQIWVQSLSSSTDFYTAGSSDNTFSGTLIHL